MKPGTKPWTGDEDDALTREVADGTPIETRDRRQDGSHSIGQRWMSAVTFICPMIDLGIQRRLDDDEDIPENEYEALFCPACAKVHLINRKTGKPLAVGIFGKSVDDGANLGEMDRCGAAHRALDIGFKQHVDERAALERLLAKPAVEYVEDR